MTAYPDVIQGALYDERGLALILFTRHREEIAFRTMAQTPNRVVLAVDNSEVKGLIFRKFVITLTDSSGRSFQFSPKDIGDVCEGSVAGFLNLAWEGNTLLAGHQFTPDDFWTPLSETKTTDALKQFAKK